MVQTAYHMKYELVKEDIETLNWDSGDADQIPCLCYKLPVWPGADCITGSVFQLLTRAWGATNKSFVLPFSLLSLLRDVLQRKVSRSSLNEYIYRDK